MVLGAMTARIACATWCDEVASGGAEEVKGGCDEKLKL